MTKLFCVLFLTANLYAGHETGNGGHPIALNFFTYAKIGLDNLIENKHLSMFDKESVTTIMNQTELIVTNQPLYLDKEKTKEALLVNYHSKKEVHIHSEFKNLSKERKIKLAIHEYLTLAGLEKNNYTISSKIHFGASKISLPDLDISSGKILSLKLLSDNNEPIIMKVYANSRRDLDYSNSYYSVSSYLLAEDLEIKTDELKVKVKQDSKVVVARNKKFQPLYLQKIPGVDSGFMIWEKQIARFCERGDQFNGRLSPLEATSIWFHENLKVKYVTCLKDTLERKRKNSFLKSQSGTAIELHTNSTLKRFLSMYAVTGGLSKESFITVQGVIYRYSTSGNKKVFNGLIFAKDGAVKSIFLVNNFETKVPLRLKAQNGNIYDFGFAKEAPDYRKEPFGYPSDTYVGAQLELDKEGLVRYGSFFRDKRKELFPTNRQRVFLSHLEEGKYLSSHAPVNGNIKTRLNFLDFSINQNTYLAIDTDKTPGSSYGYYKGNIIAKNLFQVCQNHTSSLNPGFSFNDGTKYVRNYHNEKEYAALLFLAHRSGEPRLKSIEVVKVRDLDEKIKFLLFTDKENTEVVEVEKLRQTRPYKEITLIKNLFCPVRYLDE